MSCLMYSLIFIPCFDSRRFLGLAVKYVAVVDGFGCHLCTF